MFDFFGKKHRQQLFDRAYAEFVSENYFDSIKLVSELLIEDNENYLCYNLRAKSLMLIGNYSNAFHDVRKSIDLEPNIDKNHDAYVIRNNITKDLQKSNFTIYELLDYFSFDEVLNLILNNAFDELKKVDVENSKKRLVNPDQYKRIVLIILTFLIDKSFVHPNVIGMKEYKNDDAWRDFILLQQQNLISYFLDFSYSVSTRNTYAIYLKRYKSLTNTEIDTNEFFWDFVLWYKKGSVLYNLDEKTGLTTSYIGINSFVWDLNEQEGSENSEYYKQNFYILHKLVKSVFESIINPYNSVNQAK